MGIIVCTEGNNLERGRSRKRIGSNDYTFIAEQACSCLINGT